jgi:hypothetical protein
LTSIYAVPTTIDPTGTRDVTTLLNTFIASVPDGSTIRFPRNARYRVEGTLMLVDRIELVIEGNGATFFAATDGSGFVPPELLENDWPRARRHWMILGGRNIVIRSVIVRGANPHGGTSSAAYVPELEAQHGFDIRGVHRIKLDSVVVSDVYGDFVYLGMRRSPSTWTRYASITNSRFRRSGRHAFALTGVRDAVITRNYVDSVRYSSIDIEPLGVEGGAQRVAIKGNRFGPGRLIFFAAHGMAGTVEDITLENNRVEGGWMQMTVSPPLGSRRARFRIVGNVSDRLLASTKPLMTFRRIDGLVVRNNRASLAEHMDMTGVLVEESCGIDVGGNSFTGAATESRIVPYRC